MGNFFGSPIVVHQNPVVKGDTISVYNCLDDRKRNVQWKDGEDVMSTEYFVVQFVVKEKVTTGKGPAAEDQKMGVLFIENAPQILQAFEKVKFNKQPLLSDVVVTGKFQYGEIDTNGKLRWLAYHNRMHRMTQHQFIVKQSGLKRPLDLYPVVAGGVGYYLYADRWFPKTLGGMDAPMGNF